MKFWQRYLYRLHKLAGYLPEALLQLSAVLCGFMLLWQLYVGVHGTGLLWSALALLWLLVLLLLRQLFRRQVSKPASAHWLARLRWRLLFLLQQLLAFGFLLLLLSCLFWSLKMLSVILRAL